MEIFYFENKIQNILLVVKNSKSFDKKLKGDFHLDSINILGLSDPKETKNLISDHPDIQQQLAAKLTALINSGRSTPGNPQKNDTPHWRDLVWIRK